MRTRRLVALLAAVIALITMLPASAKASNLQADMETILSEEQLVGAAWFVMAPDTDANMGVAGYRDNERAIEFSLGTRFHVGSVTKAVLSTGILRMATTGLIDLDAPVNRYLPNIRFANPWENQSPVTVRHLLDHTAGLDDARLWQVFSEDAQPDLPLSAAVPDRSSGLEIRSQPGRQFAYSNMGYTLLGMIIEAVSGERYEAYLDANLLAPLQMSDSTFQFTAQSGAAYDPSLSWGHLDDGSRYGAAAIYLRPAGQFTTTLADMALFAQFLLGDGRVNGEIFIDEDLMSARARPRDTDSAVAGLRAGYSLGMGRRDRHGVVGHCHGGNIVGFSAMLCIFPEEGKAFFYSVNTDSETANYGRLQERLINALALEELEEPPTADPASDIADWHGYYVMSPNRFATFEYLDTLFGYVKVSGSEASITLSSLQAEPRDLRPLGGYAFSAGDRTTQSHVFYRSDDGANLIGDGFQTYRKVSPHYLLAHWISLLLAGIGLVWFLATGLISLIRRPKQFLGSVPAPAFFTILMLFLPLPFFFAQSFMALGDFTMASGLLALVTMLLPVGAVLSLIRVLRAGGNGLLGKIHAIMALCILQWSAVLIGAGLMPLRLWV